MKNEKHKKEVRLTSIMNDNGFEVTIIERDDEITWEVELQTFYGGTPVLVILRNDDSIQNMIQICAETLLEEKQISYEDLEDFNV